MKKASEASEVQAKPVLRGHRVEQRLLSASDRPYGRSMLSAVREVMRAHSFREGVASTVTLNGRPSASPEHGEASPNASSTSSFRS